jgi:hypothetical protein
VRGIVSTAGENRDDGKTDIGAALRVMIQSAGRCRNDWPGEASADFGTLAETPADVPDARFALPSTIHWIRALAMLIDDVNLDFASGRAFYRAAQPRSMPERELNTVCEQLLFVLNQIAALKALTTVPNKADVARVGIVTWYYGVYSASSAMIAAADGSFPDNHTDTARQWHQRFSAKGLAMPPFADCLPSLTAAAVESGLLPVRARGVHSLVVKPTTVQDAWGCCRGAPTVPAGPTPCSTARRCSGLRTSKYEACPTASTNPLH